MFPPSTSLWQAQTAQIMAGDHADGNSHHVGSRPILETPTLTTTQRLPEKGNTSRSEKRKNVSSNVEMEHRGSSEGGMTGQEKLRPIQNGSFFGAEAFSSVVGRTKFPSKGPSYPPRQNYPPLNPADQNPPCNTLYVGNLPIDTSEEELKAMFSKQRGYKRLCFRTKQNGPMCFVEFEDIFFATKALHELYGQLLHNSVKGGIRLSFSKNPLGVRSGPGQRITTPKDGLSKLISSASGRVMTVDEGDISRNKPMKPRCDSNDSGFESLPPQQGLPNALHANEGIPAPTSDLPTSSTSATESNVGTVPSVGTTMLSDIVQESIAHICEDLYHKLEPEICPTSFGAMIGNFGELIKAFAIQLGLDQSHHMGPSIMYFVYKHHK
ncbi:hypothetical protein PFICI_10582 [Pestalotiopsis fici W106-1]|uniref:RRM domain-containing protein n=1 Tax=Pestalotiopsis fici (strain W106-1 / CGMCC3.15140) TaxID=1229662 RepID=W3WXE4_PESFW|nr:uncharacterized protein PFICI_10582 [Pestalotiopsis fici W106-1]ETS78520.1 hypothetical protein PFICI_10582 [Pestalotiopsis fici W106-1]